MRYTDDEIKAGTDWLRWAKDDRGYLYGYLLSVILLSISMIVSIVAILSESEKLGNLGGCVIGFGALAGLISGMVHMIKEG